MEPEHEEPSAGGLALVDIFIFLILTVWAAFIIDSTC